MKILTITIPVYNTENYLRRCLDSLLLKEVLDDLEIIAVNDGSKDNSIVILREYEKKYPNTVKVIDKENGGHGSTINAALEVATGKYFRVIDSDDWVNSFDFIKLMYELKQTDVDLVVTNYSKEYVYNSKTEFLEYPGLENKKIYLFDKINLKILNNDYFVMATSIYKTEVLIKSKLKLLEKTFYVDMQYNIIPIKEIKTFQFFNLDVYRYFIGRPDQSMNLKSFVRNRSNHEKVLKLLIEYYENEKNNFSKNKNEYISMILYYMITTNYYIYCVYGRENKKKLYKEVKDFDNYLKVKDLNLYKRLNNVGQIKYNRRTKFVFVHISNTVFSKLITICGKLIKR